MKMPIISGDGYLVEVEPYKGKMWLHCSVTENKPSIVKNLLIAARKFRDSTSHDFYALRMELPSKHFMKMLGFDYLKSVDLGNGNDAEIWVNKGVMKNGRSS